MECDICGNNQFNGTIERPYKNCLSCGAMERHRYLARMLSITPRRQFRRVLDIAPFSKLIYGEYLCNQGCEKYISIDKWRDGNPNDKRDVSFASHYIDVIGMESIVGIDSYDMIIMEQVLDEIEDYKSALFSIHKAMDKGGMFLCDVAIVNNCNSLLPAGKNRYGNVWKFGDIFLLNELKHIFDNVILDKFNEAQWNGHLFTCLKK
jgi:hypothetical protein